MVHKALAKSGNARKYILIPDSAHGTNPASAAFAGYQIKELKSNSRGTVDIDTLAAAVTEDVAALMITVPNTLGVFESDIKRFADILHHKGAYLYCDGANLNSFVGIARPGDMGIDVIHSNLHKTFSTPHGGGGPGAGPVGVSERLVPFLPTPTIERRDDGTFYLDHDHPESIGRVRAFNGNFGVLVRALTYMRSMGPDGLRRIAQIAVLNANYIRARLRGSYHLPYDAPSLHEVVFSDKLQTAKDVHTLDIAKRLMDYGFHPPTIYFPLIVVRRADDRADRERAKGRAGRLLRRHDRHRPGMRRAPGAGAQRAAHDAGEEAGRGEGGQTADIALEEVSLS